MTIKTNKLISNIDYAALGDKYDFFVVTTSESYFKGGASVLDTPLLENNVQSVLFDRGRSFYILMLSSPNNKEKLRNALHKSDEKNTVSFSQISPNTLEETTILQLLLNGLGSVENEILRFNNLTGHLYCFHSEWIIHGKHSETECIFSVPCLEAKISKDNMISLSVRTFTSVALKKKITFKKKRFEDYPQYVFSDHNTLRRKLKDDSEPAFILRQIDNKKNEITFLDIQNIDKFQQSKMGVLYEVLRLFNHRYLGIASIFLATIEEKDCIEHKRKNDLVLHDAICDYLQTKKIRIVDKIKDEYSADCCLKLIELLNSQYGITARIGKDVSKEALNIVLIHNAEYYVDAEDPHNAKTDCVVQHITLEDFIWDSKFALNTIIHEILIKNDIENRKISLFDWNALGLSSMSFGLKETIDEVDRYFFMNIDSDGTFSFSEQELDLFNMNDYYRYLTIFEDGKTNGENIIGLICDDEGSINVIKDTECIMIPEIDKIHDELQLGNNKLRGKKSRNKLLAANLDIKSFIVPERKGLYYFVGDIGEGMRWTIRRAANIRYVEPYENAPLLFTRLLPLMDVSFVRNGQLTVMPFPFKYLREYIHTL